MDETDQNPGAVSTYQKPAPAVRGKKGHASEGLQKKRPMQVRVRVYFGDVESPAEFEQVCKEAEAAGCRRPGLPAFIQKKHGFPGELVANTDGVAEYLKKTRENYQRTEHLRLAEAAAIAREEAELAERKKKAGLFQASGHSVGILPRGK